MGTGQALLPMNPDKGYMASCREVRMRALALRSWVTYSLDSNRVENAIGMIRRVHVVRSSDRASKKRPFICLKSLLIDCSGGTCSLIAHHT